MDPELRQAFTALDGRLAALQTQIGAVETQIGAVETQIGAVETKIGAVESRLLAQIDGLRAHTDERIDAVERRFREQLEETETKLLTAFHNWASPNEARQRTHAAALRAIDLELEALSERVTKLDGNPPQ